MKFFIQKADKNEITIVNNNMFLINLTPLQVQDLSNDKTVILREEIKKHNEEEYNKNMEFFA